jgi:exonuclease V gamma subunit
MNGPGAERLPVSLLERTNEIAYQKVTALVALLRLCKSKAEVNELFELAPMTGDYIKLPDGKKSS